MLESIHSGGRAWKFTRPPLKNIFSPSLKDNSPWICMKCKGQALAALFWVMCPRIFV